MIECKVTKRPKIPSSISEFKFDFSIKSGSFTAIYGESGAGKTSLLRIISGLLKPDAGSIICNGTTWFESIQRIHLTSSKRGVGFVFQDCALFPNMSVRENLEFACTKHSSPKILSEVIEVMELGNLSKHLPSQLSGGQQQRVAIARAIAQEPELLLLDEPFSALDLLMQTKIQGYLTQIHKELQLTTLLVTHDISQIRKMADHVLFVEKGSVVRSKAVDKAFSNTSRSEKFQLLGKIMQIR
ncbi:MAG: ATP-binding cassette domain-containing protein, partial [Bacteroidota bacterium]